MKFLSNVLAAIIGFFVGGALLFFLGFAIISGIAASAGEKPPVVVKDNSILKIKLSGNIKERASEDPFSGVELPGGMINSDMALDEFVATIKKAKNDDNIKGIYLDLGVFSAGMATVETMRDVLKDFKASGKFIYAYTEIMSEKAYYFATLADKIYMYPTGLMEWNGLASTPMFLRGTLDKLGIQPYVFKVGTYKSAAEMFSEKEMSDANEEQINTLLNDFWDHMITVMAKDRGLNKDSLNALATRIKVTDSREALKHKLIDDLKYWDEVEAELKQKTGREEGDKLRMVKYKDYVRQLDKKKLLKDKQIAVIYAIGGIQSGEGDEETIGSESLAKAIREARKDDKIKAIVLRINSPGGSALASDVIAREVELAKKAKPVYASYGDVAASGGYYISAKCDKIYAEPTTITGSIGVIGIWMNTQNFFNRELGVTFDRTYSKDNSRADIGNPNRPMTDFEREKIQSGVNKIYGDFIEVVQEGRGFPDSASVDAIAQGRVWSGVRAKEIKLVDEIGGLEETIAAVAKQVELGEGEYEIKTLPEQKNFFERFLKGFSASAEQKVVDKYLSPEQQEILKLKNYVDSPEKVHMRWFWNLDIN